MIDISKLPKPIDLVYIKYEPIGADANRSPILIHHGIFSYKELWSEIGDEIAKRTKRIVYCLDIRDHGSAWTDEFVYESMISDLVNFLNVNKINKCTVIGHSLGGLVASRMATIFPDLIDRLIIVDVKPNNYLEKSGSKTIFEFAVFLRQIIETLRDEKHDLVSGKQRLEVMFQDCIPNQTIRKSYIDNLTIRNNQLNWKFNLDILFKFWDTINSAEDMRIKFDGPVLIVHGEKSLFISKDDYDSIKEAMPNIQFRCIDNADHSLHLTHPSEFIEKLIPFLNQ